MRKEIQEISDQLNDADTGVLNRLSNQIINLVFTDDQLHPDCVPLLCKLFNTQDLRSQIRALDSSLHIILTTHAFEHNPMIAVSDKFSEMYACSDHLIKAIGQIVTELPEPVIRSFYVFDIVNHQQFVIFNGRTSELFFQLRQMFKENIHYLKMIALDRLLSA